MRFSEIFHLSLDLFYMHVTQLKFYLEDVKCCHEKLVQNLDLYTNYALAFVINVCVCKFSLRALNLLDPVNDICTLNICNSFLLLLQYLWYIE